MGGDPDVGGDPDGGRDPDVGGHSYSIKGTGTFGG